MLFRSGRAATMGDGWETRRRRGPGNDWVILKLGRVGRVKRIEIDTNHFKGNYPDTCSVDGCFLPDKSVDGLSGPEIPWKELLPKSKLLPHRQQYFEKVVRDFGPVTHDRLNIYPDGGVSRMRVFGIIEK